MVSRTRELQAFSERWRLVSTARSRLSPATCDVSTPRSSDRLKTGAPGRHRFLVRVPGAYVRVPQDASAWPCGISPWSVSCLTDPVYTIRGKIRCPLCRCTATVPAGVYQLRPPCTQLRKPG